MWLGLQANKAEIFVDIYQRSSATTAEEPNKINSIEIRYL